MITRPRPSFELVQVLQDASSYSFPRGNAVLFGLFFIGIGLAVAGRITIRRYVVAAWFVVFFLLALVGLSRSYLGAHWTSDVISGYMFALVWVFSAKKIEEAIRLRLSSKP